MSQPASRLQVLANLKTANLDAAFATAFITLMSGTFLVGFVRYLGGSDFWIGITAAIPSLLGILQIPGAIIGRRFSSYKKFVFPGGFAWRAFYIPLVVLPFVPWPSELKLTVIALCLAFSWAATQFVNPIYTEWLAEMVPTDSRGWFFSRRNGIAASVGAIAGMAGGLLLDGFKRNGQEPLGYGTIFGLGMVFAAVSMWLYLRMSDHVREHPVRASLRQSVRAMLKPTRDRSFQKVLVFFIVFIAGQAFAGNLFSAFALESLHMDFTVLQATGISMAVGQIASIRMWGYLSDKYGNKPIIAILTVGLFITPSIWLICAPGQATWNAVVLIIGHVFNGFVWAGVGVCQFNLLLATAKPEDRANYLGVGMALQALVAASAPMAGAYVMSELRMGFAVDTAYKIVFLATMVLRLSSLALLIPVREPGATAIGETIHQLRQVSPRGYAAMRKLTKQSDVGERESAMASLASENFALAGDEIVRALHDPSPRIRRQAAAALAKLTHPEAVNALVHQLHEHPDLVEEETVEALGDLGDPKAIDALVLCLSNPRPTLRRAAAKALGRIGSQEAAPHLIKAAGASGDPDLRRAALQALRVLGVRDATPQIAQALLEPLPSLRLAAAEAVAEIELADAAWALREALEKYGDESESELAYALGCVGSPEDLGLILSQAAKCTSIITRRRALLGVARLLGVEQQAYRVMLLSGMSRDSALLEYLRPAMSRVPYLREATDLFLSGNELDALQVLARERRTPVLELFVKQPVEELFLPAALSIAAQVSTT